MIGKRIVDTYDKDLNKHMVPLPCHTKFDVNNCHHCQSGGYNDRSRCRYNIKVVMMLACSVVWCGLLFLAIPILSQAGLTVEAGGAGRRTAGRGDARTPPENEHSSLGDRLAALEHMSSGLATRVQELETRNRELELAVAEQSTEPGHGEQLQQLVDQLERGMAFLFPDFNTVTSGNPLLNADERTTEERMGVLRDYLGNREAELAALRPDLVSEIRQGNDDDEEDLSVDLETIGLALQQLSSQNAKLAKEVEELKGRRVWEVSQSGGDREDAEKDVNVVREELMDTREDNYLEESERARQTDTRKSAFSVASSQPQLGLQGQMQYVTFDYNISNKGGDFYFNNNSFTCRIPGFYFFTFTLRTYDNRYLNVVLMKNDLPIVSVNTDLSARSISSTQTAILRLSQGDSVWLRIPPSENVGVYSDGSHYTTFSGFLVYSTTS